MRIQKSDLNFEKFNILACSFAVTPSQKKISKKQLQSNPIEFDFDILFNKNNGNKFKILVQIESNNNEKPKPGYIFSVVCEAYFYMKGMSKLTDNKKDQYILFTALPLTISMIRSNLYNLSSNYPQGHYLLPSIDLISLFDEKFKKK